MSFKNLKVKIILGFREDQQFTIDGEEAHKAYYIFLNPEKRTIFSNGLAVIGKNIQQIVPDYQATMGWNSTHELDGDDWNEIKKVGIDRKFQKLLSLAKEVASLPSDNPQLFLKPLSEVEHIVTPVDQISDAAKLLANKFTLK